VLPVFVMGVRWGCRSAVCRMWVRGILVDVLLQRWSWSVGGDGTESSWVVCCGLREGRSNLDVIYELMTIDVDVAQKFGVRLHSCRGKFGSYVFPWVCCCVGCGWAIVG